VLRAPERLVHQRTELVNALRGVLYEYGYTVSQGIRRLKRIQVILDEQNSSLTLLVREACQELMAQIAEKTARIEAKTKRVKMFAEQTILRVNCRRCPLSGMQACPAGQRASAQ